MSDPRRIEAPSTSWTPAALARLSAVGAMLLTAVSIHAQGVLLHVEAEDLSAVGGGSIKVIEREDASGGKTVTYWEDPGVWIDIPVTVPQDGAYVLALRYALTWDEAVRKVFLDGAEVATVTLDSTGSWADFVEKDLAVPPLTLSQGKHVVRLLNHESVGLSLDRITLHSPEIYLSDRLLAEEDLEHLLAAVPMPLGAMSPRLSYGDVALAGPSGPASGLRSAALHGAALGMEEAMVMEHWRRVQTPTFRLLMGWSPASAQATGFEYCCIWLTDGASLSCIVIGTSDRQVPIPAPFISPQGMLAVTPSLPGATDLNLGLPGWAERTQTVELAAVHVAADPELTLFPWSASPAAPRRPRLQLSTRPWRNWHVGVVRYTLRKGQLDTHPAMTAVGQTLVLREANRRFPTLARFYGEGMFDLTLHPGGTVSFRDVTAETRIQLWPLPGNADSKVPSPE